MDRSTQVGFKIIINPVFLREEDWFELPKDWSPNIVTGKGYNSSSDAGQYLLSRYRRFAKTKSDIRDPQDQFFGFGDQLQAGYTWGAPAKIRIGQRAFRSALISAYEGKCAATGSTITETLEAAHIIKFSKSEHHSCENGLLLRTDVHALFDSGLIEIDENFRIRLTPRFRELYPTSSEYDFLDGRKISLPKNRRHFPSVQLLNERRRHREILD